MDSCVDPIMVVDGSRTIRAVNAAFTGMFGFTAEEAVGQSTRLLYPDEAEFLRQGYWRKDCSPDSADGFHRARFQRKDGSVFTADKFHRPVRDADGDLGAIVSFVTDASERTRLNDLLKFIISMSNNADNDTEAVVTRFLERGAEYFSLDAGLVCHREGDDVVVRYAHDPTGRMVVSERLELDNSLCGAVLTGNAPISLDHTCDQSGHTIAAKERFGIQAYIGQPLRTGGDVKGTLCFFGYWPRYRKFTDDDRIQLQFLADWLSGFLAQRGQRAEMEQLSRKLAKNVRQSRRLYRETPAMLHSVDPEGRIVEVSDHWLWKLGYESRDEVIGRPVTDFHPPAQRERVWRNICEFWRKGEPRWNRSYDFLRKDGTSFEIELSVIVAKPKGEERPRSLAVSFDVTERNRTRRQLERKYEELESLNQELDTFTSIASHDLQEPLRKIQKFSEILEEQVGGSLNGDAAYALQVMRGSAARMQTLIDDLLTYARTSDAGVADGPVELEGVLVEVKDELSIALLEAGAEIRFRNLPTVHGSRGQIIQLFRNLVANAIKYREPARPCRITVGAEPREADRSWVVSVCDNGTGFNNDAAKRIFLPFHRCHGKSLSKGSGLGLTICGRIAERHGWSIGAKGQPGQGAVFWIAIPDATI